MAAQRKEWRAVTAQQPDGDSTSSRCKLYFQAATCAAISQKQVGGFRESSGVGNHGHASKRAMKVVPDYVSIRRNVSTYAWRGIENALATPGCEEGPRSISRQHKRNERLLRLEKSPQV